MDKKDKELVLKDLSARLPYDVCVHIRYKTGEPCYGKLTPRDIQWFIDSNIKVIKPYLRPISSMTEEEKKELLDVVDSETKDIIEQLKSGNCGIMEGKYHFNSLKELDWLNAHHFDYRGLIEKGLAIAVTKENNPYGKK